MKIVLFVVLFALTSCATKNIQKVNPDLKTKFGFEITAPTKAVYFVTNQKIPVDVNKINDHQRIANYLYSIYGPATDDFFIAVTNAKDVKFNIGGKSYYIEIEQLAKRNAMILFDGKNKPLIEFDPKKYDRLITTIK